MDKHTPGPWEIGNHGSVVIDIPPKNDADRPAVEFYGGYVICESIQTIENARLIAAAPELLNAAEQLVYQVSINGDVQSAAANVVAAIAKARGE